MEIDPAVIGRSYPGVAPHPVGAGEIARFADAIGDPHPAYRDAEAARAAGHPAVVAPPTYPIVLCGAALERLMADPDLNPGGLAMVHRGQSFDIRRPIRAGDHLRITPTITGLRILAGVPALTVTTDISTVEGEPVCTATSSVALIPAGAADSEAAGAGST
ncbi:MaoC family dehydratase N-terminal domain-containing protein [Saccharopolyspora erythraea]|uniref:FAS1-like dehydratase domain-containing protein n=1 Tax=Saccharopolyspora erythraea TaxID=1836 RepID=UPI001BAB9353|nr:MaoC family dehydratase N-terminal domain-containing protein [Saccharopolyspora erythraea]QUH02492.1 MaoC family dehydratase N-terminal domain-containing protein [Saccharopolyspora erythraea]